MNTIQYQNTAIQPSKIVCIGRNYVDHAKELNNAIPKEPVIFIKPNSAISDTLSLPAGEALHYEGELCFLVQQQRLAAVGFGLDLTKRQLQSQLKSKGLPWERAKAFDGSALFSEFVPFNENDIQTLGLELRINQTLVQKGGYGLMLFKPEAMLRDIQAFLTLEDGDIIMTGTPAGVGEIKPQDHFEGRVYQGETRLQTQSWTAR